MHCLLQLVRTDLSSFDPMSNVSVDCCDQGPGFQLIYLLLAHSKQFLRAESNRTFVLLTEFVCRYPLGDESPSWRF